MMPKVYTKVTMLKGMKTWEAQQHDGTVGRAVSEVVVPMIRVYNYMFMLRG
jgi:hypothetical protein